MSVCQRVLLLKDGGENNFWCVIGNNTVHSGTFSRSLGFSVLRKVLARCIFVGYIFGTVDDRETGGTFPSPPPPLGEILPPYTTIRMY